MLSSILLLTPPNFALAGAFDLASNKFCQVGKSKCVELVIKEMKRRYQPLAQKCDRDALFALTYLRTTETFLATLNKIGYENPAAIIREDALFAEYYFRAYDAYHSQKGKVPPAWQVAFDVAQNRACSSAGNLVLGFNAHIQRDLPFVLYELYLQGHPVSYADHNRVNQFLRKVNVVQVAKKFDSTIDDSNQNPQQQFQLIAQWREGAYRNYERLRDAKDKAVRMRVAAEIEDNAAATAAILRKAFSYPPGADSSQQDAYCQAVQGIKPKGIKV